MKTVMHILLAALMVGLGTTTKAGNPVWEEKFKAPQINMRPSVNNYASMGLTTPATTAAFDKCRKYKSKQVAGWVLMPVGLGMMAGGTYMIYTGAKNIVNNTSVGLEGVSTSVSQKDKMFVGVGAGLGFAGAVLFPTGLVLAIKGGTNYNRDCRGGTAQARTLYLRPTGKGLSMSMKF